MARGSQPGDRRGGRTHGVPNKSTVAARQRIESEADPIGFLTEVQRGDVVKRSAGPGQPATEIAPTLDQSITAARILADKLVPAPRGRRVTLPLGPIHDAADLVKAADVAIQAMAAGEISPDEAAIVMGIIEQRRRLLETADLECRLAALEAASASGA